MFFEPHAGIIDEYVDAVSLIANPSNKSVDGRVVTLIKRVADCIQSGIL